jgi:hypothetical protein
MASLAELGQRTQLVSTDVVRHSLVMWAKLAQRAASAYSAGASDSSEDIARTAHVHALQRGNRFRGEGSLTPFLTGDDPGVGELSQAMASPRGTVVSAFWPLNVAEYADLRAA